MNCNTLCQENNIGKIYSWFTKTHKRIPVHYDLGGKLFAVHFIDFYDPSNSGKLKRITKEPYNKFSINYGAFIVHLQSHTK